MLDHVGWRRTRLNADEEAVAWLAQLERGRPGSALRAELVDEGVLRYDQLLAEPTIVSSCTCESRARCRERDDDFVFVRRTWMGPVPSQVLAAFEART